MASAPAVRELLDGDVRLENRGDYIFVWHARAANDLPELETILGTIDEMLTSEGLDRVMFDSRDANYKEGDVQTRMWEWLEKHTALRRVATLVNSPRLAVSVQLTGMSKQIKIKAFNDEGEATGWLAKPKRS